MSDTPSALPPPELITNVLEALNTEEDLLTQAHAQIATATAQLEKVNQAIVTIERDRAKLLKTLYAALTHRDVANGDEPGKDDDEVETGGEG